MKIIWRLLLKTLKFGFFSAVALLIVFGVALAIGLQLPVTAPPSVDASYGDILITGVNVIEVDSGKTIEAQTVAISNGRINYVGAADRAPSMPSAIRISGQGKFLIPGLWDMHVHTISLSPQLHFPLLIANGITHIRDMGDGCSWRSDITCQSLTASWRQQISAAKMIGPAIHQAAHFHVEEIDDDAEQLVRQLKQHGDEMIKLQLDPRSDPAIFYGVLEAAKQNDMPAAGHLPYTVDLLKPGASALKSIEHDNSLLPQCSKNFAQYDGRNRSKKALLEQADPVRCDQVLANMAQAGTAYTPTHVASNGQDWMLLEGSHLRDHSIDYVVTPQRWLWWLYAKLAVTGVAPEHYADVKAYYDASLKLSLRARQQGVTVLAGSDAIDAYVTHGFSLHQELQQLVLAGFTPAQALASAITVPVAFMGKQHEFGRVAENFQADLILLNKNPLLDIGNTQEIDSVIHQGRLINAKQVQGLLDYVKRQANSYAMASQFIWRMMKP